LGTRHASGARSSRASSNLSRSAALIADSAGPTSAHVNGRFEIECQAELESSAAQLIALGRDHVSLMIEFVASDFVALGQFRLAMRFTDPAFNVLPPEALADIRPLAPARAAALNPALTRACAAYYSDTAKATTAFSADGPDGVAAARVGRELAALPVGDEERVVVSWDARDAVETSVADLPDVLGRLLLPALRRPHDPSGGRAMGLVLPSRRVVLVRDRSTRGLTCVGAGGRSAEAAAPQW